MTNPEELGIKIPEELPEYRGEIDDGEYGSNGQPEAHVYGPVKGEGPKLDGFVARFLDF